MANFENIFDAVFFVRFVEVRTTVLNNKKWDTSGLTVAL